MKSITLVQYLSTLPGIVGMLIGLKRTLDTEDQIWILLDGLIGLTFSVAYLRSMEFYIAWKQRGKPSG